jgi:hypothetical protein
LRAAKPIEGIDRRTAASNLEVQMRGKCGIRHADGPNRLAFSDVSALCDSHALE